MKKAIVYNLDEMIGGEVGIEDFLSQQGYKLTPESKITNKQNQPRGHIQEGKLFSEYGSLELYVFDDPILVNLLDNLLKK